VTAELLPITRNGNSSHNGAVNLLCCMLFGRFLGVIYRVVSVSRRKFRMVRGLLVIACFVMLRCFAMLLCSEFEMFGCLLVVRSTFMSCHVL
jgi:hypothetical protein